jgi:single-stranded DNA-binding protein
MVSITPKDQSGADRYTTEVVVSGFNGTLQMLDRRDNNAGAGAPAPQQAAPAPTGQSVMHLHVHLIPRYKGDVEDPKGGVRWVLKNKANYWDDKKNKVRDSLIS